MVQSLNWILLKERSLSETLWIFLFFFYWRSIETQNKNFCNNLVDSFSHRFITDWHKSYYVFDNHHQDSKVDEWSKIQRTYILYNFHIYRYLFHNHIDFNKWLNIKEFPNNTKEWTFLEIAVSYLLILSILRHWILPKCYKVPMVKLCQKHHLIFEVKQY